MNLEARFKQKYVIDTMSGCWNWTASLWTGGYGQIGENNKNLGDVIFAVPKIKGV